MLYSLGKMRMGTSSLLLAGLSIASLATATALPALNEAECYYYATHDFNGTGADTYVRCAESTYFCKHPSLHGGHDHIFLNRTVEPIPADCVREIDELYTSGNFTGPLALPGLTQLMDIDIDGTYEPNGTRALSPTRVTTIDLPDLVKVGNVYIRNAVSISSLSVPKLREVEGRLGLNFTGGPAVKLSFPSLARVYQDVRIEGEIDSLDFPALNKSYSLNVSSTGNLDCNAFAATVKDAVFEQVVCTSKNGTYDPSLSDGTSVASSAHGGLLALTALLAYMLAL